MPIYDGDTFTRGGRNFRVNICHDHHMGPPWKEHDGHGPVREAGIGYNGHPQKRPGERVLQQARRTAWLYDWQDACKQARKDGWNAPPYDAPGRVERAVQADFDYLRRWLDNQWSWVYLEVTLLDAGGGDVQSEFLGGFESTDDDGIAAAANELADQLLYPLQQAWRRALAERRVQRNLERLAAVQAAALA